MTYLLQLIDSWWGLDSCMEETQYPSHNVDSGLRDVRSCLDLSNMAVAVLKLERFGELGSQTLSEFGGLIEITFPWDSIELCEGHIWNLEAKPEKRNIFQIWATKHIEQRVTPQTCADIGICL